MAGIDLRKLIDKAVNFGVFIGVTEPLYIRIVANAYARGYIEAKSPQITLQEWENIEREIMLSVDAICLPGGEQE